MATTSPNRPLRPSPALRLARCPAGASSGRCAAVRVCIGDRAARQEHRIPSLQTVLSSLTLLGYVDPEHRDTPAGRRLLALASKPVQEQERVLDEMLVATHRHPQ